MTAGKPDISVVTVTYNERENIREMIPILFSLFEKMKVKGEVVVVDDDSPDGTYDEVRKFANRFDTVTLVHRKEEKGIASAYRDGVNAAKGKVIVTMDADFNHPPSKIPELYSIAKSGKIGWGSRYLGNTEFEVGIAHKIGTYLLNAWVSALLRTGVKDNTYGFMAIEREKLDEIRAYSNSKGIDPFDNILYGIVVASVASRLKMPLKEIKAPLKKRRHGDAKISFRKGMAIVLGDMILAARLMRRLR